MPSILACHPNPLPSVEQNKRERHKYNSQATQQSTSPPNSQIMEHRWRKKRKSSPKRRPHEIIPCKHTRRIPRVSMRKVTKDRIENQTTPKSKQHRSNNRHNPMHTSKVPRPAKPEEWNWQCKCTHTGRWHLPFRWEVSIGIEVAWLVLPFPVKVRRDRDADCWDKNAHESEAALARIEAVDFREDDWEGFEPGVEDTVDEGDVEV